MLVLKAQMCLETQRFFRGLEKKNIIFQRVINHEGKNFGVKTSLNFERMAGPLSILHASLYGAKKSSPPGHHHHSVYFFFMFCYHKLNDKETLMTPDRTAQPYNPLLPRERCSKRWFLEKSYKWLPFRQDLADNLTPQTTAFIHPALIKHLLDARTVSDAQDHYKTLPLEREVSIQRWLGTYPEESSAWQTIPSQTRVSIRMLEPGSPRFKSWHLPLYLQKQLRQNNPSLLSSIYL